MLEALSSREKYEKMCSFLKGLKGAAVAYSGGVDSSLLLHAAVNWCSGPVFALIADSVFVHGEDMDSAHENADEMQLELIKVTWNPLAYSEIACNNFKRCYYCKFFMYKKLLARCSDLNISTLMDGTHIDDLRAQRPGLQAIRELGIITPLSDFLLDKQDIRHLSLLKSLKTWRCPSQSCLATRIETGSLMPAKLSLVARVEAILSSAGIKGGRFKINNSEGILIVPDIKTLEFNVKLKKIKKIAYESGLDSIKIACGS